MRDLLNLLDKTARQRFVIALGFSALAGIMGTALLGLSGWFLTAAALAGLAGSGHVFNHLYPSAGVRGFAFGRVLTRYAEQLVGHDATLRLSSRLRSSLFAANARAERGFTPLPSSSLSALIDDVDTIEGGFLRVLSPVAAVVASVFVALGFAVSADPMIGGLTLIGAIVVGWLAPRRAAKAAEEVALAMAERTDFIRTRLSHLVDNAIELDVYGVLPQKCERTANALYNHQMQLDALEKPFRRLGPLNAFIGGTLAFLLIARSAGDTGSIAMAAGGALAILSAFDALGTMAKVLDAAPRASAAMARISERLKAPEAIPQPDAEAAASLATVFPLTVSGLLTQAAPNAPMIGPLTFQIRPGSVTFLIGPSGSGKTTLMETLLRLHPVQDGMIAYAGCDANTLRTPTVLTHMAVSPQFEAFLPGTIRDQFKLADPDASDAAIWGALEFAGLDNAIHKRPDGLDHRLHEGAAGFSGGEMRRLNLARAFLTDPEVLILDEPFAGLEPSLARAIASRLSQWAHEHQRALVIAQHETIDANWDQLDSQTITLS